MTLRRFIQFDVDGRITRTGIASTRAPADPTGYYESGDMPINPTLHYVVNDIPTERPACPVAIDSVAGLVVTLSGIPLGATLVAIRGTVENSFVQDDPDEMMEFTAPVEGDYVFSVELFPQQSFSAAMTL